MNGIVLDSYIDPRVDSRWILGGFMNEFVEWIHESSRSGFMHGLIQGFIHGLIHGFMNSFAVGIRKGFIHGFMNGFVVD